MVVCFRVSLLDKAGRFVCTRGSKIWLARPYMFTYQRNNIFDWKRNTLDGGSEFRSRVRFIISVFLTVPVLRTIAKRWGKSALCRLEFRDLCGGYLDWYKTNRKNLSWFPEVAWKNSFSHNLKKRWGIFLFSPQMNETLKKFTFIFNLIRCFLRSLLHTANAVSD